MLAILQNILPSLVKVQDEDGNAILKFPDGSWHNGIGDWRNTEGYYIYINSSSTLSVSGNQISLPLDIPLTKNKWNIISYPYSYEQNALTYFNSLISSNELIKVQDYQGNPIVKLPNNDWYDGIGNLKPGEGYYVYVNSDVNLQSTQAIQYTQSNAVQKGSGSKIILKSKAETINNKLMN